MQAVVVTTIFPPSRAVRALARPLPWIERPETIPDPAALVPADVQVGIWQALADGEPDVDAIYRLTCGRPLRFAKRAPWVLPEGVVSPVNSQNAAFRRELFALLYLPAHVGFRFSDILRALIAQPLMWTLGMRLGVTGATARQQRNPHDLLADFAQEIPFYPHSEAVVEIAAKALDAKVTLPVNLRRVYAALVDAGIVPAAELLLLDAWLADIAALGADAP